MNLSEQKARHRYTPEEDNLIFAKVTEAKTLGLDLSIVFLSIAEELGGDRSINGVKQRWGRLSRLHKRGDWKPIVEQTSIGFLGLDTENEEDQKAQTAHKKQEGDVEVVRKQVNLPINPENDKVTDIDPTEERIKLLEEQLLLCTEERNLYKSERDFYKSERDFYRNERDAYKEESIRVRESMKNFLDH
ncbi:hypothetical protein M3_0043 [Lysinibacillus phage vB_LfM_LysYB1]|nr:hypothetical protein M3_0043 [Lysinibacillus phage vB_LfM_LysYB1]WAB25214.1 hypothetical protein M5_0036 [Lysinibacillus phage vB_LfM_LysYB2]